jgi:hypothetical protein
MISANGCFVGFNSDATNLVGGINKRMGVFAADGPAWW